MSSVSRWVRVSCAISVGVPLAAIACSHDKPAETGGYQQGQTQPNGYPVAGWGGQPAVQPTTPGGAYGAPTGYGQPTATVPVTPPAAGGVPGTVPPPATPAAGAPAASGTAQPLDAAAASVVAPVMNGLAKSETVAGAKPVGAPLVGNFQTGQTLTGQVQLQPNKCYTVVAT
ncbi:MAG TPA: hypothetical protein VFQ35_04315, partial [Polyangiaceae bacterium]|nr:hypothetical protein [Polyangiaceae bacterium]